MEFFRSLIALDTQLFLFINGLHNSFFDVVMWAMSNKIIWIPLYANVIFILVRIWRKEAIWAILALIACIVLADQISSGVLKEWVQRPRPTHEPSLTGLIHTLNGYVGGKYGFVSSHAANAFGFALLSSLIFRERKYTVGIMIWAFFTAYSRIYLGVHYPLDVIGGTLVGLSSAVVCYVILKKTRPEIFLLDGVEQRKKDHQVIPYLIIISLVTMLLVTLINIYKATT